MLAFIHRTKKETDENSNLVCDKRITIFSDSIIISVLDVENSLLELILDIRYLQQNSVMHGLLLRGGISIGKLIHTEKDIYGPVFIDAYKLESECAIYPRIILHPNIFKNI